jgi:hypothetical protein
MIITGQFELLLLENSLDSPSSAGNKKRLCEVTLYNIKLISQYRREVFLESTKTMAELGQDPIAKHESRNKSCYKVHQMS